MVDQVGNLTYYDSSGQSEYNFSKPYSEKTAELIDKEISNLIETQYQRAIDLLEANKEKLTELANVLLAKEVIFKDNREVIFGKRPFEKSTSETKAVIQEDTKTPKTAPASEENDNVTN